MCGIFGFSGKLKDKSQQNKLIKELFILSESRGKEACGFSISSPDKISYIKTSITASDFIKYNKFNEILNNGFSSDKSTLIGHSRLVTNGYEQDNNNNQPVIKNGIITIHNGIIANQKEIWDRLENKSKFSDLDTELIPTLLNMYLSDGLNFSSSIKKLYDDIEGIANIALLFEDREELVLATNNGSIYYTINNDKSSFIFASERQILNKIFINNPQFGFNSNEIIHLKPGSYLSITNDIHVKVINYNFDTSYDLNKTLTIKKIIKIEDDFIKKSNFKNTSMEYKYDSIPIDFLDEVHKRFSLIKNLKRCSRCILPQSFPGIHFDEKGVCNYCNTYSPKVLKPKDELLELVSKFKSKKTDTPDCILPFSGGRDSSYALHYCKKELGLNPIAFSYDWGMLTDLARRNQSRMCAKLGVEHILVSADIRKKRNNIKKNVLAWLNKPHLGAIPLFMAGDKHYFYYNNLIMKENNLKLSIMGENHLERTGFKTLFSGAKQEIDGAMAYNLSNANKLKMINFYAKQFLTNTKYFNSSLIDTTTAFFSYYGLKHDYFNLFDYIDWDESTIENTILNEYNWEKDPYIDTTWRIGDGTVAFYNYIYYIVAGFTENDTFRSNQIREHKIERNVALSKVESENKIRWESIQWYCNTIGIDWKETIKIINKIKPLYG